MEKPRIPRHRRLHVEYQIFLSMQWSFKYHIQYWRRWRTNRIFDDEIALQTFAEELVSNERISQDPSKYSNIQRSHSALGRNIKDGNIRKSCKHLESSLQETERNTEAMRISHPARLMEIFG